ncbi:glycosyl transferase [Polaribacter sp. SA4-10]|uniref:nucleotidyltransferase family protein n=1 Tax=Polaribacter sp. SA4-10 TaxID=754397 RepID=UPI000B3BFE49|nr:nucleotidyltransferase family protein [Polaribacter sp. SA4-10]ARV07548.1 glycosyl transferase [Polaribacter sp. SA4-10]
MKNIAVLILAAGKSSRMGFTKQLLKVGTKTLLERAIEAGKKSKATTLFCVLGANLDEIKNEISTENIEFIINKNYEKGLSSSIVTGINFIEKSQNNFDAVLITLADQPKVDSTYLNQLIETFNSNSGKIIASKYDDKIGVPAIFPKIFFKKLVLLEGDKGAKNLLNSKLENILAVVSDKLLDIDTKEDYKNYIN